MLAWVSSRLSVPMIVEIDRADDTFVDWLVEANVADAMRAVLRDDDHCEPSAAERQCPSRLAAHAAGQQRAAGTVRARRLRRRPASRDRVAGHPSRRRLHRLHARHHRPGADLDLAGRGRYRGQRRRGRRPGQHEPRLPRRRARSWLRGTAGRACSVACSAGRWCKPSRRWVSTRRSTWKRHSPSKQPLALGSPTQPASSTRLPTSCFRCRLCPARSSTPMCPRCRAPRATGVRLKLAAGVTDQRWTIAPAVRSGRLGPSSPLPDVRRLIDRGHAASLTIGRGERRHNVAAVGPEVLRRLIEQLWSPTGEGSCGFLEDDPLLGRGRLEVDVRFEDQPIESPLEFDDAVESMRPACPARSQTCRAQRDEEELVPRPVHLWEFPSVIRATTDVPAHARRGGW